MDIQATNGEGAWVCSFYHHKKKTTAYLRRNDGQRVSFGKIGGKRWFWKLSVLKAQSRAVGDHVKRLKAAAKYSKSKKKEYKKALPIRDSIKSAVKELQACVKSGVAAAASAPVRWGNVENLSQQQCMSCHGVLGWENTEAYFRDSGKVIPGALDTSPFYTFLSGNPEGYLPGYMPKGLPPLSQDKILLFARWILQMEVPPLPPGVPSPTPTPNGPLGEGRALYNQFCSSCHGLIDVSSKYGRSEAQILAAMNSIPQMIHLKSQLSSEQIQKIVLALNSVQPPEEGTVSVTSLGPVVEGNPGETEQVLRFEIRFTGTASQPFTVGYVTTSGSAFAGSDFEFAADTVQFQAGADQVQIVEIPVYGDTVQEQDESMFVDIGGVSVGTVGIATGTASGVIVNDDFASPPPASDMVRLAYNLNEDYLDTLGLSHATPQPGTTLTDASGAKVGAGALLLDDDTDHLLAPGANLTGSTDFTFGSWVFWTNTASTTAHVFNFGSSGSNYAYFNPRDTAGRCRFEMRVGSIFTLQCNPGQTLPENQWVYLAVTFNSVTDEMKIFFNGQEVATRTGVTLALSGLNFTTNFIGEDRTATPGFTGRIDEVIVWNAALDQQQITAAMNMTSSATVGSTLEVSQDGQIIPHGATINFGELETGMHLEKTFLVQQNGPGTLEFLGDGSPSIAGLDSDEFSVQVQLMPWQMLLGINTVASFMVRYTPTIAGNKVATLSLSNSDELHGGYALLLSGSAVGEPLGGGGGEGGGGSPDLVEGQNLYAVNCSGCHGSLGQSTKSGASLQQVTAALDPVTGILEMRSLGLSTDQIEKIVLALNTPLQAPDEPTAPYVVNVGTATYVASKLARWFLPPGPPSGYGAPDQAVWNIISQGVLGRNYPSGTTVAGRREYFHGRCQRFDSACLTAEMDDIMRPVPDTIRAGLVVRVCSLLMDNTQALNNVLGKVGLTTASELTVQNVKLLHDDLFAEGKPEMPLYKAEAIHAFPNGAPGFTLTDKWRFMVGYFCTLDQLLENI